MAVPARSRPSWSCEPTASGRADVVYSRCQSRSGAVPTGCDVYAYNPRTHRENRYRFSTASHSEVHPTYWDGRVAFVRYYGSSADPHPVVHTRRASSSRPSQRLPGLPRRRCIEHAGCGRVTGTVDALELYGDHLAQTAMTVSHALRRRAGHLGRLDRPRAADALGARGAVPSEGARQTAS
ncbi:MAG TPA: hypothetical protein VH834_21240 [Solirubrobacteraceae bacterium]|jgi:hypothetical protein